MIDKWGVWREDEEAMLRFMEEVIYYEKQKEV